MYSLAAGTEKGREMESMNLRVELQVYANWYWASTASCARGVGRTATRRMKSSRHPLSKYGQRDRNRGILGCKG